MTTSERFLEADTRKQIKNELRTPNRNLAIMLNSNGIAYPHIDPSVIDTDSITGNSLRDIKLNLRKYARIINRRLSNTEIVDDEFRVNRSFKDKLREELIVYTPFSLELQDGQILTGLGRQYGSDKGYTMLKKNEAIKITKWFLNSADITPLVMPNRAIIADDNKIAKLIAKEIDKSSRSYTETQDETTDPAKVEIRDLLKQQIAELKAKLGETQADSSSPTDEATDTDSIGIAQKREVNKALKGIDKAYDILATTHTALKKGLRGNTGLNLNGDELKKIEKMRTDLDEIQGDIRQDDDFDSIDDDIDTDSRDYVKKGRMYVYKKPLQLNTGGKEFLVLASGNDTAGNPVVRISDLMEIKKATIQISYRYTISKDDLVSEKAFKQAKDGKDWLNSREVKENVAKLYR